MACAEVQSEQDVQLVLQEMDLDGSGQIDFDEFQRCCAAVSL
jgi:Ca2+-binding EF-hand superfamily protein